MTIAVIVFYSCLGVYLLVLAGLKISKTYKARKSFMKRCEDEDKKQETSETSKQENTDS